MENLHKLLDVIEKGDPLEILSEEKLTEGLNELLKNDLISFEDGKVVLTEKGRELCTKGPTPLVEPEVIDEAIEFSAGSRKKSRLFFLLSFFILLVMMFIVTTMALSE